MNMKIGLLIIGDEILLGQVTDTNSTMVAKQLFTIGFQVNLKVTVGDTQEEILRGLEYLTMSDSKVILMSGGLGPTKDDITKTALAAYLNRRLVFSEEAKQHVQRILQRRNRILDEIQLNQCYVPEFSKLLDNELGTACGIMVNRNEQTFVSMPGVPYELEYIMTHHVLPELEKQVGQSQLVHKSLLVGGLGETQIARRIEPLLQDMPSYIRLAYLPSIGQVRLRLTTDLAVAPEARQLWEHYLSMISGELSGETIGFEDESLESAIGNLLVLQGKSISTAESFTAGLISSRIASIPGASRYFRGGITAYHPEIKIKELGIDPERLMQEGVVSEYCVGSMVRGACRLFGTDVAIASTGAAGPTAEDPQLPVGTVWLACGNEEKVICRKFQFSSDRKRNTEAGVVYALLLLWEYLRNHSE